MPPIEEKKLSPEDKERFDKRNSELESSAKDDILKSLDLGLDLDDDKGPAPKPKPSGKPKEIVQQDEDEEDEEDPEPDEDEEDESEDDADDEDSEESEESEDDEESDDEAGEDVEEQEDEDDDELEDKSKKKVQKRIDKITAEKKAAEDRAKALESELEKYKNEKVEEDPLEKDTSWKQLESVYEKLGEKGIEELQDEIAVAMRKAEKDEDLKQLQALNRLSNKFLREYPVRFERKQISVFKKAVLETATKLGVASFQKIGDQVLATASQIYSRSQTLKKSLEGQAEAWRLAVEHHEALIKSQPKDKDREEKMRLKRENNKLKKKTSLDAKSLKGAEKKPDEKKMRKAAARGDSKDKLAYVKSTFDIDSLIPEDLRT